MTHLRQAVHRIALVLLIIALSSSFATPSYAQSVNDSTTPANSAPSKSCLDFDADANTGILTPVPRDIYSVYLQLGKRGQRADATLLGASGEQGPCSAIGSASVTGDGWTLIGNWQMTADPAEGASFKLESDQLDSASDANRPTVLLVSNSDPVCTPNPYCQIAVGGFTGVVLPPSNSIAANALRVARVVDPAADTVIGVTYYINERPMYTTKQLEPFDLRYVVHGQQRTVSIVQYSSGQRISVAQPIPSTHSDTFFNYLFRLYRSNPPLLLTFAIAATVWIVGALIFAVIHALERRRYYRLAHGFIKDKPAKSRWKTVSNDEYFRRMRIKSRIATSLKLSGLLLIVVAVSVAFNRYIATAYSVNGVSMENAYKDSSEVIVNRIPVTLAQTTKRNYIPKRGEVVILRAAYGFTQPQTKNETSDYIIKRVIGLPGERVTINNGEVTIHTAEGALIHPDTDSAWEQTMIKSESVENIDITLGEEELFVSGDNRPESIDSRFNGAIRADQLIGTVGWKLW